MSFYWVDDDTEKGVYLHTENTMIGVCSRRSEYTRFYLLPTITIAKHEGWYHFSIFWANFEIALVA